MIMAKDDEKELTNDFGAPVDNDLFSVTAGEHGPILIQDTHLTEKLAHFDRERIPERVVHAKGAGAHGYFEVIGDVSKYTHAGFLSEIGKKTEVFARFSTVGGEKGSADSVRDPRGFALKFYTEEGNYDMVGNNTPIFFIRDPLKFPDFIHTQKRNPATNLKDPDMFWDFLSLTPESIHQVTILFSDRGTPRTFRNMNGRDGAMRSDGGGGGGPNYWPNSFGGPNPNPEAALPPIDVSGLATRHEYPLGDIDFVQAGLLYGQVMNDEDREHLVSNIVGHLGGAQKRIQLRQTALFYKASQEYGERVAEGLGLNLKEVKKLAGMSQEERVKATAK